MRGRGLSQRDSVRFDEVEELLVKIFDFRAGKGVVFRADLVAERVLVETFAPVERDEIALEDQRALELVKFVGVL